ncbi:MAG TPA: TonB-dependent receptor [Pyrinomonadaceae bacterium]|nr:TonB-dependent receptor [Pyrinomonadaceae bacterium]
MSETKVRQWGTTSALPLLAVVFTIAMLAGNALAQSATGQIVGKVTDPNGAVVAGAKVTAKSVDTGRETTATSDDQGSYTMTALQPGLYDVVVQAGNFKASNQRVQVTIGSKVSVDTQLALTEVTGETVSVIASEGVEVNTQTPEVSNIVTGTQIRELPTLTRNPYDLIGLANNVANDDPGPAVPGVGVSGRGVGYNINGLRAASTNVLLDGVDNNNVYYASLGQNIPLDAVGEFRVVTSNFSAEYGRASGGIVNVLTRSGSNAFHGSAFEFNRISKLASNGFQNNANNVARGVFTRNQFGYTFGGPAIKDKLFFFNSTEWTRVRSTGEVLSVVPTAALINASAAATRNYFSGYTLQSTPTGTRYTVDQLVNTFNLPAGNAFAALPGNLEAFELVRFTEPTNLGGGVPQNTYSTATRVDFNLSSNTLLYGRYARESKLFPNGTSAFSPYTGFDTPATTLNNNFLVSLTHTFSPRLVSESKLAFNRLNNDQPYGANPVGPGLFMFPGATGTIGGNAIAMPGYWPYNAANSPAGFGGPQNLGQAYEDLSYTLGRHQLKFGGQYIYIQNTNTFGAYQNAVESLGAQGNYAQALGNFVTGNINQFQAAVFPQGKIPGESVNLPVGPPDFTRSNRYNEWAAYINDSFRVRPGLVLNLGVRYEYYGVQHNKLPELDSNFYFGSGANLPERIRNGSVQVANASPVGGLWAPDKNNFAPRLGFAWDVFGDGKTSLRGGYGLAYERNFGNVTFNVIQNPPSYAVLSLFNNVDVPGLEITTNNAGPLAGTTPPTKVLPVTSLRHVREDIVNAYAHFYSFALQRELSSGNVLSIEYAGSRGEKLYSISPLNITGSGAFYLGDANPNSRLNNTYSNINTRGNEGYSRYNALIVALDGNNFRHTGMQFTLHYTFAKANDNLSSTFSEGAFNSNLGLTNPYDPSLDFGPADYDVRHRFVSSVIWQIPFAKSTTGVAKALLDGWSVTGILNARTGTPFTIFDSSNANLASPRLVPNGPLSVNVTDTGGGNFFNYIDLTGQPVGAFGNPICGGCSDFGPYPSNMTRRNQFRGPGYWNLDAGVSRNIKLTERYSLQLRGEMFNALNHANLYIAPGTQDVANGFVGAVKGVTPNGNVERRNVQLAVKLIF